MKTKTKAAIITFAVAVPAFVTGRMIWPPAEGATPPTAAQIPHLMFLSGVEAIALGLGVAFLVLAWPMVKRVPAADRKRTVAAYLSLSWLLINWWSHDNMHAHNGENFDGLIRIEYGYHVTLVIAALIVAHWFLKALPKAVPQVPSPPQQ
ncbi:MAG TPA: hypothetical protein VL500_05220 [Candidatus Eisenbacteria bacterium]|jgi:uncharacterized membrane protein YozB (DUF420 family)|nr:hypothetical protein [Candidatus Eisenbacteria bacterium]